MILTIPSRVLVHPRKVIVERSIVAELGRPGGEAPDRIDVLQTTAVAQGAPLASSRLLLAQPSRPGRRRRSDGRLLHDDVHRRSLQRTVEKKNPPRGYRGPKQEEQGKKRAETDSDGHASIDVNLARVELCLLVGIIIVAELHVASIALEEREHFGGRYEGSTREVRGTVLFSSCKTGLHLPVGRFRGKNFKCIGKMQAYLLRPSSGVWYAKALLSNACLSRNIMFDVAQLVRWQSSTLCREIREVERAKLAAKGAPSRRTVKRERVGVTSHA